jgi:hypothetical protein
LLVAESEQRGAFVREDCQAHYGLALLLAHPVSDIRLGVELGGQLRDDGECLLGCESLGEVPLRLQGRVGWPPAERTTPGRTRPCAWVCTMTPAVGQDGRDSQGGIAAHARRYERRPPAGATAGIRCTGYVSSPGCGERAEG